MHISKNSPTDEGKLKKVAHFGLKEVIIILFNDVLVHCSISYKFKACIDLLCAYVEEVPPSKAGGNLHAFRVLFCFLSCDREAAIKALPSFVVVVQARIACCRFSRTQLSGSEKSLNVVTVAVPGQRIQDPPYAVRG